MLQMEHWYGISPVCRRICLLRSPRCMNSLLQSSQQKGLSPEWIIMCCFNPPTLPNLLPQILHSVLCSWFSPSEKRLGTIQKRSHIDEYCFDGGCDCVKMAKWLAHLSASHAVGCWFVPRTGPAKDRHKNGTNCLSAWAKELGYEFGSAV